MSSRLPFSALVFSGGLALAIGTLAFACKDSSEPPDDTRTYVPPAEAGSNAVCTGCVVDQCAGTMVTCLLDERCRAMHACASATGCNDACRASCVCSTVAPSGDGSTSNPSISPQDLYYAFSQCTDARTCGACADDCKSTCTSGAPQTTTNACGGENLDGGFLLDSGALPDGGDASTVDPSSLAPTTDRCSACVVAKCNDPKRQCGFDTECALMLACIGACANESCVGACKSAHPSGVVPAGDLRDCVSLGCHHECGF